MKNIGIDLVEIEEIKKRSIEKISERILSDLEKNIYNNINHKEKKISFLAGRWASKEAIFKAYQKGNSTNNYRDWSILNNPQTGFPYVKHDSKCKIMISISHTKNYALAFVILL
ncbi:holo-[acyl-carrier-protein] synthase [Candidatus Phytoplasma luffae]|uniref:Holo-[acyl-carrier-protein] synthase n=1 Tax=Loofah witches'-broom phytoplasma TaxID=35773 RepID=A0A975FHW2_LOWBP|nr:holo-ACP synthase [Candidatus Phytoplasma luffae]QTX02655.1 holo-[acyl-carrier-protein] synthase [Candidatus Phytoplasma luffae]